MHESDRTIILPIYVPTETWDSPTHICYLRFSRQSFGAKIFFCVGYYVAYLYVKFRLHIRPITYLHNINCQRKKREKKRKYKKERTKYIHFNTFRVCFKLSYHYIYIYIYAFSRRFYPKRLTLHSSYSFYILSALVNHYMVYSKTCIYNLKFIKCEKSGLHWAHFFLCIWYFPKINKCILSCSLQLKCSFSVQKMHIKCTHFYQKLCFY